MSGTPVRFDDGAAYERMMGVWSRLAGEIFLDWVAPAEGLRWADVGCGNGAFTELLVDRCAPAEVQGVDPSEGQLAFARTRPAARLAKFQLGDAMALPFPAASFDAAVMALVIFFVPEPEKGVAEMARVVKPGGLVCAYAWDMYGGGFPLNPVVLELRALGLNPPGPPNPQASRIDALEELWRNAGIARIETRDIAVTRTFDDFEDYWATCLLSPSLGSTLTGLPEAERRQLFEKVRARMPAGADGRVSLTARANAIKGRMPE